MAVTRILAIDGGGVKGLIPTILLQRLSADPQLAGWLTKVDLIAGTSTGGLIALALGAGLDLAVIRSLYEQRASRIFADSLLDDVVDLGKLIGADYDVANLRREVHGVFGELTLGQLTKRVLITAFDLDNEDPAQRTWKPKVFHNFPGSDSDGAQLVYKVGTYTSAGPTFFPSADGYVDGGVFAANPSMCALAQTQDARIPADERGDLGDIRLLSLGTGRSLVYIEGDELDWGYAQWAPQLISLMLDGTNGTADYQCAQILGPRYLRLAPTFPPNKHISQDAVGEIAYLTAFAQRVDLDVATEWIKTHW